MTVTLLPAVAPLLPAAQPVLPPSPPVLPAVVTVLPPIVPILIETPVLPPTTTGDQSTLGLGLINFVLLYNKVYNLK